MNTPSNGTYAVILAALGLGAWVVHDAVVDTAPTALAGNASEPPPIELMIEPAPPAPIQVLLVPGEPGTTELPDGQENGDPSAPTADGARYRSASPSDRGPTTVDAAPVRGATPSEAGPMRFAARGTGNASSNTPQRSSASAAAATPPAPAGAITVHVVTTAPNGTPTGDSYQILAVNGSIVYIGPDGELVANTGATSSSGVVALGVDDSSLETGTSTQPASHANGSFDALVNGSGGGDAAISGFEDHSVSVVGDDQIVTYDDSNVFVARNGQINANTGDTDSSGLNAVDVVGSRVRSGNSGDREDADGEGEDHEDEPEEEEQKSTEDAAGVTPASRAAAPVTSSPDDDDELTAHGGAASVPDQPVETSHATVSDEGASEATGPGALAIGADGYDDVSIRSRGDRNIVTYDDSNVVIGGTGDVNAQVGDSDTGGAVVMGIENSDLEAGCEGDLCD